MNFMFTVSKLLSYYDVEANSIRLSELEEGGKEMYRKYNTRSCGECEPRCNPECPEKMDIFENMCKYVPNKIVPKFNECECGFEEEELMLFPVNPMFGQSYVPWQTMAETFIPRVGTMKGTIFPELFSPYSPEESLEFNKFVACRNKIGEGCNR